MDPFFSPRQCSEKIREQYGWGFTLLLANEEDTPTGEERVLLDYAPEHVSLLVIGLDQAIRGLAPGH